MMDHSFESADGGDESAPTAADNSGDSEGKAQDMRLVREPSIQVRAT